MEVEEQSLIISRVPVSEVLSVWTDRCGGMGTNFVPRDGIFRRSLLSNSVGSEVVNKEVIP